MLALRSPGATPVGALGRRGRPPGCQAPCHTPRIRAAQSPVPLSPDLLSGAGPGKGGREREKKRRLSSIIRRKKGERNEGNFNKRPTYGSDGTSTQEGGHGERHQPKGAHPSCNKQPTYGMEGGVCAQHKKGGMVNTVSKRCGDRSCNKYTRRVRHGRQQNQGVSRSSTPKIGGHGGRCQQEVCTP